MKVKELWQQTKSSFALFFLLLVNAFRSALERGVHGTLNFTVVQ